MEQKNSTDRCDMNNKYRLDGLDAMEKKDYDKSMVLFDKAIDAEPDNGDCYYEKGLLLTCMGRHQESLPLFDMAIALGTELSLVYSNKGSALYFLGMLGESMVYFNKSLDINPHHDVSHVYKAEIYLTWGDPRNTLLSVGKILDEVSFCFKINLFRGVAYMLMGSHVKGVEHLDVAISIYPDVDVPYYHKGMFFNMIKKYDAAIECFDQAITLNPRSANTYLGRGDAKVGNYDISGAVEDFKKSIGLDPSLKNTAGQKITLAELIRTEWAHQFDRDM